jgi:signal transduction histidine kinase/CHASE3 domain sensor protein
VPRLDLSIEQRLAAGFGFVVVLLVGYVVLTGLLEARVDAMHAELRERVIPSVVAAGDLERTVMRRGIAARTFALTQEPDIVEQIEQARHLKYAALDRLERFTTDPAAVQELRLLAAENDDRLRTFVDLVRRGVAQEELRAAERELTLSRERVLVLARQYFEEQFAREAAFRQSIIEHQEAVERWRWLVALVLVVTSVLAASFTARAVSQPARRLHEAARAIRAGDYGPALALAAPSGALPQRDELRELAAAFADMALTLQARERRMAADAHFSAALAASAEAEQMVTGALREMAEFGGFEAAAMYLADAAGMQLQRFAAFAPDDSPRQLPADQGLAGEAFATGRRIVVRDIPPDTPLRLRLGFGDVVPRSLVAVPVAGRERSLGVVLLGSLREPEEGALEFLDYAVHLLGISLHVALAQREIASLASELKQKNASLDEANEELQAQNEELQAQSEELCAQTEELREANDRLQQADEAKNNFVAVLAHELRNPLAPILSTAQAVRLRAGSSDPELRRATELIERQVKQLTRLVDDLLDVTRIARGKVELQKERVELSAVLGRAIEISRPLIEERSQRLEFHLADEPLWLEADSARLAQVFSNLLNNAAKFTPDGGEIRVVASQERHAAVVRVRDTGIGIAPEMLARVFIPFTQILESEAPARRSNSGLGIGLSLVQQLVQLHGGSVEAHSEGAGCGSEFVVRLPLRGGGAGTRTGLTEAEAQAQAPRVGERHELS